MAFVSPPSAPTRTRRIPWYLPRDVRYRRHLRFTREGKLFVFVTLGLGFAAVNTGTNLMYLVFGFMLSLIVLSGVLSEHVLRGLTVQRRLPSRVVAGEPTLIEIVVHNHKERMVSYSVEVEDQALSTETTRRCYFLKVAPRGEQAASYRRVPAQRGILRFQGFSIATRFPFALFEKWREAALPDELVVYPTPLACTFSMAGYREQGERGGSARGHGTETRELRDYQSGDEVRKIHWRRSASLGKPVVRELEQEASSLFCIMLDNREDPQDRERWRKGFEQNVSRAAYLVERGLLHGARIQICARSTRSLLAATPSERDALLRFLALLEPVQDGGALATPAAHAHIQDLTQNVPSALPHEAPHPAADA